MVNNIAKTNYGGLPVLTCASLNLASCDILLNGASVASAAAVAGKVGVGVRTLTPSWGFLRGDVRLPEVVALVMPCELHGLALLRTGSLDGVSLLRRCSVRTRLVCRSTLNPLLLQ